MKSRPVVLHPDAEEDLLRLYEYIAVTQASPINALNYLERIEDFCRRFDIASERGTARDDIRNGLRTISFEKRCLIAFQVQPERVVVLRVFHGGQDWEARFDNEAEN